AFAHGSFNITNTIIQLPFIAVLAWLVTKLIPGEDIVIEYKPEHLDPIFIEQSPAVALDQAKLEVVNMGEKAIKGLKETKDFMHDKQAQNAELALQIEGAINYLDRHITSYLIHLSRKNLDDFESRRHTALIDV